MSKVERRTSIVFCLPHGPQFYREVFTQTGEETARDFDHVLRSSDELAVLSPAEISMDVLHPRNFLDMVTHWTVSRIWLVDRIRGPEPIIQIVDHVNRSGQNPLRGKTPVGDRPRFPDAGGLYVKDEVGLPQRVVTTVGPDRFESNGIPERSELAAWVALCAGYVGMEVVGIGWNDLKDPDGVVLGEFVNNKSPVPKDRAGL